MDRLQKRYCSSQGRELGDQLLLMLMLLLLMLMIILLMMLLMKLSILSN